MTVWSSGTTDYSIAEALEEPDTITGMVSPSYETVFRSIEWEPGRSGEIAPVAVFETVEIDGCSVSRANLHNLSFIRDLELYPGCRIFVSKRNMIIPHIEENLDRGGITVRL